MTPRALVKVACSTIVTCFCVSTHSVMAVSIDWEVGNRFRAFDYMQGNGELSAARSANLFEKLAPRPDEPNTQSWIGRVIAAGGSPYAEEGGPWIEDVSNGGPVYKAGFVELPERIVLRASLRGTNEELASVQSETCAWRLDEKLLAVQRCTERLVVEDFSSSGGQLSVHVQGTMLSSARVKPRLRIIVGIGDSYAAGEGSRMLQPYGAKALRRQGGRSVVGIGK